MFRKKETAKVFGFFLISVLMFSVLSGIVAAQITAEESDNGVTDADIADLKRAVEGLEEMKSGLDDLKSQVPGSSGGTSGAGVGKTIKDGIDSFSEAANPVLKWFLGPVFESKELALTEGEMLLVKLLLFVILLAISFYAAQRTPGVRDTEWLSWIIAIVFSMLATRFLSTAEIINFAFFPTGAVAVTFLALFAFIIFLFFIESFDSQVIRIVGWVAFSVIFFGLAIYRWDALAVKDGTEWWQNLGWIYVAIALISLLIIFVLDKTIRAKLLMSEIAARGAQINALNVATLQSDIQRWKKIISDPASTAQQVKDAQKEIKEIEKRIKILLST